MKKILSLTLSVSLSGCFNQYRPTIHVSPPVSPSNLIAQHEASCNMEIESEYSETSEVLDTNLQLALARICVSEAGFQVRTLDCRLIYETLRYRSDTGEITMGMMRAYSTRTFDRSRTDDRRWIPYLNAEGTRPRGWNESGITVPWSARREDWLRVYRYVGYLLSHPQPYPCPMRVHHWGARGFRYWRHIRAGWIPVNCGEETANTFWHVPNRRRFERNVCVYAERVCR